MTLGIYIHIPFCRSKCSYCHFLSMAAPRSTVDRYQNAVMAELGGCAEQLYSASVDSIYFGGGTPSLIPGEHIENLVGQCRRTMAVVDYCEISLEANPGTLSSDRIASYRRSGVNRVSVGAQSFSDSELSAIGRVHDSGMIKESLSLLRQGGIANINVDLMLGLPGQTSKSWKESLEGVERLEAPHVSVYMLDLDEECPLHSRVVSGAVRLPDEDLVSDLYLETIEFLGCCGLRQYEISNFAAPGYECRHNLKYWLREPVRGVGLGSHSFDGKCRYANCSQMAQYLAAVESGRSVESMREPLTEAQALAESLFLGLRLEEGVDCARLEKIYGDGCLDPYQAGLQEMSRRGLVEWNQSHLRLTPSGKLLSNEVFQLFV